ncbi:MAG: glycosyltransferase [Candidatus Peribacteraceae bacterium]|nr:glycosyltransferase [Candidatus Peribacteraceae bacterium]
MPVATALPAHTFDRISPTRRGKERRQTRRNIEPPDISVVIPIFNERANLQPMIERTIDALETMECRFEIIIVDDHSDDGTEELLRSLGNMAEIRILQNGVTHGKAAALMKGLNAARGESLVMIDGDLQYPPEAIPVMLAKLKTYDVVVANRKRRHTSAVRSALSGIFRTMIGGLLLSLHTDVQSGLKVFRADVFRCLTLHPTPWGFDAAFLFHAQRIGCRIGEVDITFSERKYGKSKVHPLRTGPELVWGALKLRLTTLPLTVFPFLSYPHPSEYRGSGFTNTVDYLFLPEIATIKRHLSVEIVSLLLFGFTGIAGCIWLFSFLSGLSAILTLSASVSVIYLSLIIFKAWIVLTARRKKPLHASAQAIRSIREEDLPVYTVIIPLFREAPVIAQVLASLSRINYPPDKLDIIITLEEYDRETREAIRQAHPPKHFRTLILPNVEPKTKPKALNVAFLQARGDFIVIFDAEVIPEPDQLKKAYLAFRDHPSVACVQTRLDHYNAHQNWMTALFNAEFSFHYDLFLPGLQKRGYVLPLSGHSTHFRRTVLEQIGAWDPYNLTEDCDIGIRLFRRGFRTDIIDSLSNEEATSTTGSWIAQRSRWMQGFIQTSIVHLRHPLRLKDDVGGWGRLWVFLIIVPGSVLMNVLNLFYWLLLGTWIVTQSTVIQSLFPVPVLYISILSFAIGNILFMYMNLVGLYQRGRYRLVKYGLLSFFYWFLLGYAALRGCVHLLLKPYKWEKTAHGNFILPPHDATLSAGR